MYTKLDIVVVMPAMNEGDNLEKVVSMLQASGLKKIVVGVDKNTSDKSVEILKKLKIGFEIGVKTGYDGSVVAALKKASEIYKKESLILFTDAGCKYSYGVVDKFLDEINNGSQLVLGVRTAEKQHMLWHQKLGTQMVLLPIRILFGKNIIDISPFRLITKELLHRLQMKGDKFKYPSEMLVKALALKIKISQIEVVSLNRLGKSKVSASLKNSLKAGANMFSSLRYYDFK